MRSRWSSQHAAGQHAPVEMRFVDMFMTALGSLIFIALLLVFLLPKAAQTNPSTLPEPGAPLQERDTDKHVVKRWIGILLLTKGCEADDLLLYVRWDGSVMNFETRAPTGKMPEFDAGDLKHGSLVGHRTFRIGGTYDALASFPYLNVASDLLNGEQVRTMLHSKIRAPSPAKNALSIRRFFPPTDPSRGRRSSSLCLSPTPGCVISESRSSEAS
jgi:hypothetical protein